MSDKKSEASETPLPAQTIEVVAKSMFKQAKAYGFGREDVIRFVNVLLDLAFKKSNVYTPPPSQQTITSDEEKEYVIDATRVMIRPYKDDDFPLLEKWVADPNGRHFLLTRTRHGEPDSLEELVNAESSMFSIVLLEDQPIGTLAYLNLDREQRIAELRKLIADKKARGKGYGSEAARYWIEFGITNLNLHKIYLHTLENNLANIRLNEQLGFRVEGLLRDECFFDDEYHDVLRMSLIVPR